MVGLPDELERLDGRWEFFYRHADGLWHVGYAAYRAGEFVALGTQWVHPDESWEQAALRVAERCGAQLPLW